MHRRLLLLLGALAFLAACSQAGGLPALTGLGEHGAAVSPDVHKRVTAHLVIKVPRHRRHHRRGMRPEYVSPSSAYLQYTVDSYSNQIALSASNPDCTVLGPISYLQCTVNMALSPGMHNFSFTALDKNMNELSANTSIQYQVLTAMPNQIPVILGGIDTTIAVVPPNDPHVTGSQYSGYTIFGNTQLPFGIIPQDVDGNYIIGPGAPEPVISPPAGYFTPAPVTSEAPNTFRLTSSFSPSSPLTVGKGTLTVMTTPVPNSDGIDKSVSTPLRFEQPWLYANNQGAHDTGIDTLDGTAIAPSGNFDQNQGPVDLAYDSNDHILVMALQFEMVTYDLNGNHITSNTDFSGVHAIAYSPSNSLIYVADDAGGLRAIDSGLGFHALSGNKAHFGTPLQMLVANNALYSLNNDGTMTVYDLDGNEITQNGSFAGLSGARGMAYDPHDGYIYAISGTAVTVYDLNGNHIIPIGAGFPNVSDMTAITYDPYLNRLLINDLAFPGNIGAYDENGNLLEIPYGGSQFFNVNDPNRLFVVGP